MLIAGCLTSIPAQDPGHGYYEPDDRTHHLDFRLAAWDRTIVSVDEVTGNAGVVSYVDAVGHIGKNRLGKLRLGVQPTVVNPANNSGTVMWQNSPVVVWANEGSQLRVEDFPGGVNTAFNAGDVTVSADLVPLKFGRGVHPWEGGAAYRVSSSNNSQIVVELGGESFQDVMGPSLDLREPIAKPMRDLEFEDGIALHRAGGESLYVALRSTGAMAKMDVPDGEAMRSIFTTGSGSIVLAHARTRERALELVQVNPDAEIQRVHDYYGELLQSRVSTPEPDIDAAFRAAIYNLEYNWLAPFGWNEAIHHWLSFWHNQHSAAAEWLGQEDRSREVNVFHAQNLHPNGAVPQFFTDGTRKREFGGSNQFFAWQVRHFWNFTADEEFARITGDAMERVIHQTLRQHDALGNNLIAWDLQVGNQEDFIQFHHDATTPSIELINMMRTRVMLARGVGDEETAVRWEGMIARSLAALRESLWIHDLGRFGNYIDEMGKIRLDAQYHAYLYPSLWDIVDELDGYTSLRHVHDNLTGEDGRVYVSNSFPNHWQGSWGMQAGGQQQPWAAWAYSKAGQRNNAYRPLLGIARIVNGSTLRGAWPEVAGPTPDYFTPPAGLFISSVTEAIFGLNMYKPEGFLQVSPAFPDSWPEASIELPRFSASYSRTGNTVTYTVNSDEELPRRLRWSLPPASVSSVTANGSSLSYTVTPGVNRVVVEADAPAATSTEFVISYTPLNATVTYNGSVAEGQPLKVQVNGTEPVGISDRLGVLKSSKISGNQVEVVLRDNLLEPYANFGRLGLGTFSRRTFFVQCTSPHGDIWLPVDFTVLPPMEAGAPEDLTISGNQLLANVVLRNNTESDVNGTGWLHAAGQAIPVELQLPARSQTNVTVQIPGTYVPLFSLGDNKATFSFPNNEKSDFILSITEAFQATSELAAFSGSRLEHIPIPVESTVPGEEWALLRPSSHGGPLPWPNWQQPFSGELDGATSLSSTDIPGLTFNFHANRWITIGERPGKPYHRVDLPEGNYRKFYLLMATFADNHDLYSRLANITVRDDYRIIAARDIYMPGDVDWWDPNGWAGSMDILRDGRPDRLGMMPFMEPQHAHFNDTSPEGVWIPHIFPNHQHWSNARYIRTDNVTFNIVEIDLGEIRQANYLAIQTDGISPGVALLGITAEVAGDHSPMEGTPFEPPADFRQPETIFAFTGDESDLAGWTLEGDAFSVSPAFGEPYSLNSFDLAGETATGRALSPTFAIDPNYKELVVEFRGGTTEIVDGEPNLAIYLVDGYGGHRIQTIEGPGTHLTTEHVLPIPSNLRNHLVRFELVDKKTETSFAWIGLVSVKATLRRQ
ncbi:MAG: hypothetical protein JJU11_07820 [Candidatus Sumerlaeia bacterium]|nr:hypothetical protein [Candidatus Sumerlaeia bacterium]